MLVSLLAVVMFLGSGVASSYRDLDSNIDSQDVDQLLGTDRPEAPTPTDQAAGQPLNILLVGSDDRSGNNGVIGGTTTPGIRSDTVMVAHVSAARDRVELVSVPRDSWVKIPACELPHGAMTDPVMRKFNGAFELGGQTGDVAYAAACTIRTLESLTGVRIDAFIAVDFTGFIEMVDALGGVPICIPEDIDDPQSGLQLEAGSQTLTGNQALGYTRARKTIGDGSDIGRIGRQHDFLAATLRQALSQNLLTDGPAMYRFLDAATSSLTASSNYGSIAALAGLANSLRGLVPGAVSFVTVPWVNRGDGANVLWTDEADALWAAIAADQPLTIEGDESPTPGATAEATDPATASGGATDAPAADASSPEPTPSGPTLEGTTADDGGSVCG